MADKSIIILSLLILCVNLSHVVSQSIDNNDMDLLESRVNTSMKVMERSILNQLDAMQLDNKNWKSIAARNLAEFEQRTSNWWMNLNREVNDLNDNAITLKKLIYLASCKQYVAEPRSYTYSSFLTLDDKMLRHITLKKNDDGTIKYFEMHIAIKGEESAVVLLSPVPTPSKKNDDLVFEIGIGTAVNQHTIVALSMTSRPPVKTGITPDVLSPSKYVNFYIKISDGTLTVGKEGVSAPLLTYTDERVNTAKYYGFTYWVDEKEATFLHDCSPALADLL